MKNWFEEIRFKQRKALQIGAVVLLIIIIGIIWDTARATGCCKNTTNITNNYFSETTITSGVSNSELAEGLAATAAHGGHQFDYSVKDWQGSIVGGFIQGDHDENAVSFAVGKRFERIDALFHTGFTQINSDDRLFTVGGTFRF